MRRRATIRSAVAAGLAALLWLLTRSEPDPMARRWAAKRAWHERQRALPLPEKIRIVIALQRRQQEVNRIKAALGLPYEPMRVWDTEP